MTIYSFYIFDRHCTCVYYQDWHRTRRPKPAVEGNLLPAVSHAVSAPNPNASEPSLSTYTSPRNTLSSTSGVVVAVNDAPSPQPSPLLQLPTSPTAGADGTTSTGLSFDEEAKLVYGVVLSLRNMIKKISGRDEQFVNYRTSAYKLHLFETISGYKLILLSDPSADSVSLRLALRGIYVGPFLEYVVRNPLVTMDSKTHGIDNEYFRSSIDRVMRGLPSFF
ncbi:TRAPP complex subunit bet5 [Marasmius fiardii PR-910]|nr:TRAPP complex subunit bet5 [Marasmius fiardii PR-910]